MNNSIKFLSLIAATAAALGLTACGSGDNKRQSNGVFGVEAHKLPPPRMIYHVNSDARLVSYAT